MTQEVTMRKYYTIVSMIVTAFALFLLVHVAYIGYML
jgi:hypothetical protein